MVLLFHDFLELTRVESVDYAVDKVEGHPGDDSDKEHLDDKHPLNVARIEVLG